MAEKAIFSKNLIESDEFYRLSIEAQVLYFHLIMNARKGGTVVNAFTLAKLLNVGDALQELRTAELIDFDLDEGVMYIVRWNEHQLSDAKRRLTYCYRKWREMVLLRDDYTCTRCGATTDLEVHHIKSFADYPELREALDNGVTLCKGCHKAVHKEERDGKKKNV